MVPDPGHEALLAVGEDQELAAGEVEEEDEGRGEDAGNEVVDLRNRTYRNRTYKLRRNRTYKLRFRGSGGIRGGRTTVVMTSRGAG